MAPTGNWNLPPARSERQLQLHAYVTTIPLVLASDLPIWSVSGSVHKSFVSKAVWNVIRPLKQVVSWAAQGYCSTTRHHSLAVSSKLESYS